MQKVIIYRSSWLVFISTAGVALALFFSWGMFARPAAAGGGVIPVCITCTHTTLASAVGAAVNGDTIEIQDPLIELTEPITITQDITITSSPTPSQIMLNTDAEIIFIHIQPEAAVTILGVIFIAEENTWAGAIYNQGILVLEEVRFTQFNTEAVDIIVNTNQLTITNSFINNNLFAYWAGLVNQGELYAENLIIENNLIYFHNNLVAETKATSCAAPIYNQGVMVFVNSQLRNNHQTPSLTFFDLENSGYCSSLGILSGGELKIINSQFYENSGYDAHYPGRLVSNSGQLEVISSQFTNNIDVGHISSGFSSTLLITDTLLEDSQWVSAVIVQGASVRIENSEFINNGAGFGGALWASNNSEIEIYNTLFEDNYSFPEESEGRGGAIYNIEGSTLTIQNSVFRGNMANGDSFEEQPDHRGGAVYNEGIANITESLFELNSATDWGEGGAIYQSPLATSFLTVTNSTFISNSAMFGSGLYNAGAATIIDSSFNHNMYNGGNEYPAYGGAIYNQGQLTAQNTSFTANQTNLEGSGGAIYNVAQLTLLQTELTNNQGFYAGGGLWNSGVALINNSTIEDNKAVSGTGGGIWNSGQLTITSSTLEGNWVEDFSVGSAIATYGPLTMIDSAIQNHEAYQQGVPLYSSDTDVVLQDVAIQNNHTRNQTSGYEINGGSLLAENVLWHNNRIFRGTGALYVRGGATVELINNTFTENRTTDTSRGPAIGNNNGVITIINSTFADNRGSGDGLATAGAIQNAAAGQIHLINSLVENNQVTNLEPETQNSYGGGVSNAGTMWITQTVIAQNVAQFGGGIYNTGNLTIAQSAVTNNLSNPLTGGLDGPETGRGAGIAQEAGQLHLINSTVSGNSFSAPAETTTLGGGVYVGGGSVNIQFSTITNNSGADLGGGIYQTGGMVQVTGSIVAGNLASPPATSDCAGSMTSGGYNIFGAGTGCVGNGTTDSTINPAEVFTALLDTLQDNGGATYTHALLEGSPALDVIPAGANQCGTTITQDQRGEPRPLNGGCDVGAFEGDASTMAHLYLWQVNPGVITVSGEANCTSAYCSYVTTAGTVITLTAAPLAGYTFDHWQGGCLGVEPVCQLTLTQTQAITAVFELLTYPLTVTVSGGGLVTSELGSCADSCVYEVTHGETITFTAVPTAGITFSHWSGACSGSSLACVLTVEGAAGVEAVFEEIVLPPASHQVYLPLILR